MQRSTAFLVGNAPRWGLDTFPIVVELTLPASVALVAGDEVLCQCSPCPECSIASAGLPMAVAPVPPRYD